MRPQGDEPFRLGPVPASQHALHRRLQVVVADPARHAAHLLKGADMAVEERLLGLVQIHPVKPLAGRGEAEHEHPALREHAVEPEGEPPEVDPTLGAGRMPLRHLHLHQHHRLPAAHLGDVATHRRLAHLSLMLIDEALPHPSSGVPLLTRRLPICLQPGVDRRLPPI